MMQAASNDQLKQGFELHLDQTEGQAGRLEQIFSAWAGPRGHTCKAMQGLVAEGQGAVRGAARPVLDAALIADAQRIEHYEMAGYGSARTFARQVGDTIGQLLEQTLQEEKQTDEKLTQIAESMVNQQAARQSSVASAPSPGRPAAARVSRASFLGTYQTSTPTSPRRTRMQTREVPKDQWATFFGDMGKADQLDDYGPITIEALGMDVGDQVVARQKQFVGVTFETKGSGAGRIEIMVGDNQENISHTVENPKTVRLEVSDDGRAQAMQIEGEGEPTTLVYFRAGRDPSVTTGTGSSQGSPE